MQFCRNEDGTYCVLGAGAYGRVYRGIKGGVQDVAIKQVHENMTEIVHFAAMTRPLYSQVYNCLTAFSGSGE